MIEYRENDNINYNERKKYEKMDLESLEKLMIEKEKEAIKNMNR